MHRDIRKSGNALDLYSNYYIEEYNYSAYNTIKDPNPWHMNSELYFYHKDGLGSMRVVSDNYGNVSESYSYNVYGNPYEGRFRTTQNNNPFGFTGQRFEAEIWMHSFAYRTYNPVSKRWMTPDPIRDGMNWYQYCFSDPVNLWDPLGLKTWVVHGTWSDPDTFSDEFIEDLEKALDDDATKFQWTGGNTDEARREAAERLAEEIISYHVENKDEHIGIVGHSHGGNVGILAANELDKHDIEVDNLITIATPVREYQLEGDNVNNHNHIYNTWDDTQVSGGKFRLPLIGEVGPVGREFEGANNIAYNKYPWSLNPLRHFTNAHSVMHTDKEAWQTWMSQMETGNIDFDEAMNYIYIAIIILMNDYSYMIF
ncbi:RHS repeat-associated core domain-containing protein [Natronospora cellulosivora (SeqCode)]